MDGKPWYLWLSKDEIRRMEDDDKNKLPVFSAVLCWAASSCPVRQTASKPYKRQRHSRQEVDHHISIKKLIISCFQLHLKRVIQSTKYLCLYWTFISISGNIKIHDWIIIHNQRVQIANRNLNFKLSSLALFDKDFAFQLYEPELINDPWIICNLKLKTVSAAGHNTQ